MPIQSDVLPEIIIRYERGVSSLSLKNSRIVFLNRVIKEIQRFIKEVKLNIVKTQLYTLGEPMGSIVNNPLVFILLNTMIKRTLMKK